MNPWYNRSVVVIGLARSGLAAAKSLHQLGAHVIANDVKKREDCLGIEELERLGIPVICGGHPDDLITDQTDCVVKNPGVPYHVQPIQQAIQKKIPVLTEVEIAGFLTKAKIVGITGSNGKTTTTTMVGKMFEASELPVQVAGNIGTALTEVASELNSDDWLVAELSSFQLKGTSQFHPHVAACLNVYPAHLDYHQTFEDYQQSKNKLFQNQTPTDISILNWDSEICRKMGFKLPSQVIWFSRKEVVEPGVFIHKGQMIARMPGEKEQQIISIDQIALPGEFNLENALAATAIALSCGCSLAAITKILLTFRGVEHRLEYVTQIRGVDYYNDSKATNPQAARKALESFQRPLVWIAGGLDRGVDFHELVSVIEKKVKMMIAYGESAPILIDRAKEAGVLHCFQASDINEAVKIAKEQAIVGDVVLLSPACASWDQYTSFEERGSIFKQAVHKL